MVKNQNVLPGDAVHVWVAEGIPVAGPSNVDGVVSSSGHISSGVVTTTRTTSSVIAGGSLPSCPPPYSATNIVSPQRGSTQQIVVTMPAMPKMFSGLAGEDIEEWLKSFELISQANGWTTPDMKLNRVISCLAGKAQSWFTQFMQQSRTWNDFTREIKKEYGAKSMSYYHNMLTDRTRYPNETPKEYADEMAKLARKANIRDEQQLISIVMKGLNDNRLFSSLYTRQFATFEEFAHFLALKAEGQQLCDNRKAQTSQVYFVQRGRGRSNYSTNDRRGSYQSGNCYKCGKPGHFARECRSNGNSNSNNRGNSNFRWGNNRNRPPNNYRRQPNQQSTQENLS